MHSCGGQFRRVGPGRCKKAWQRINWNVSRWNRGDRCRHHHRCRSCHQCGRLVSIFFVFVTDRFVLVLLIRIQWCLLRIQNIRRHGRHLYRNQRFLRLLLLRLLVMSCTVSAVVVAIAANLCFTLAPLIN